MNNTTGKELQAYAHASVEWLCHLPGRSNRNVYIELAELSSLSTERLRKFHNGEMPNLTVDALDRLVSAGQHAMKKAAA